MKKLLIAAGAICLGFFVTLNNHADARSRHHLIPNTQIEMIINETAKEKGVPAKFAMAIARKESGLRPHVSNGGALGLFQIKCATARGIGYKGSCAGLYDAKTNARWGIEHLRIAMKRCGGSLAGAAKLHNQGLGSKCGSTHYSRSVMTNLR